MYISTALSIQMSLYSPQNYNRMNCKAQSMLDEEFDERLHYKARMGNNSGYLDEEYETTKEFPTIPEYHFRIEDDTEIIKLQKLRKESEPISMQTTFNNSSVQFKSRLDSLLMSLDSHRVCFENKMQQQRHGFYTLADKYDDEGVIAQMLDKAKLQEVRVKLHEVSINDTKPVFIKKQRKSGKDKPMNQEQEVHKLSKKFNRMTITEQDL